MCWAAPNDDILVCGYSADMRDSNDSNDLIYSTDPYTTYPDNSTDNIKCGGGKEVWVHTSIDTMMKQAVVVHEG
jgi:hypothetical protein